jgi:uncharacterized protein (UPF0261 family)
MSETIAIIATCDTKGEEARYLKQRIESYGLKGLVVDSGIRGEPVHIVPDVSRHQVAGHSGRTIAEMVAAGSRGAAVEIMRDCVHAYVGKLYAEGAIQGLISAGGAEGSVIARAAMDALPLGVPKLTVSTIASGKHFFQDLIGTNDATVMHSVIDILGLNSISRRVFNNAVGAIVGMVRVKAEPVDATVKRIAISMLGTTTPPILNVIKPRLEQLGYEVLTFHANGTGGDCMDSLAREGYFEAVIDYSTNELVGNHFGGLHQAKAERMDAALESGLPAVIVPGAVSIIVLSREEALDPRYDGRSRYYHNPNITLVRTGREEMRTVARTFAEKLNRSAGNARFLYPARGFCSQDKEGFSMWDPQGNQAFLDELKKHLRADIPLIEVDAHINDEVFAALTCDHLLDLIQKKTRPAKA